jgi:sugar (pentulose or hexulose) kinase
MRLKNITQKEMTRAVLESCAFVSHSLVKFIEETGIPIERLVVSGGLARFDVINQIKADVMNKPVDVLENFESTSIGAFILLGISLGILKYNRESINQIVRIRKTIYPSQRNHALYIDYYELFKDINHQLKDIYPRHKKLLKQNFQEIEAIKNL